MTALWAIIKLTCKSAIRSYIFILLLLILLICVVAIPYTISGDGTAWGFIQISLKYSLGIVGFILSLSTIWLSCSSMTQDVESYQLHMVISKPVSRMTIWIGKWLGVIIINSVLLLISSAIVYGLIIWQFNSKSFTEKEKKRVENEVMVGRRVFEAVVPDLTEIARKEYKRRLELAKKSGSNLGSIKTSKEETIKKIKKELIAGLAEIKPGMRGTRAWNYKGLNPKMEAPLYLRYRPYIGKISSKDQRETMGLWAALMTVKRKPPSQSKSAVGPLKEKAQPDIINVLVPKSPYPEKIMCGVYNEATMRPTIISPKGEVTVAFTNFDPQRKTIFIQAPGPKLLIQISGFFENYLRAVSILLLRIVFLAGIGCAVASFLSMPTAIFMVMSYILIGSLASYLIGSNQKLMESGGDFMTSLSLIEKIGHYVSQALLLFVIPIQNFEVSDQIANGYLIEFSYMAILFFQFFVLRGLPLILFGIWLYRRREMGLVIRK